MSKFSQLQRLEMEMRAMEMRAEVEMEDKIDKLRHKKRLYKEQRDGLIRFIEQNIHEVSVDEIGEIITISMNGDKFWI